MFTIVRVGSAIAVAYSEDELALLNWEAVRIAIVWAGAIWIAGLTFRFIAVQVHLHVAGRRRGDF